MGGATPQGTANYSRKFHAIAADAHFRKAEALTISSLGIGTYLGRIDAKTDQRYTTAIEEAVARCGINLIDTAINYRLMRSERSIGAALEKLARSGFTRDEIVICTKAGYMTEDGTVARDPNRYFVEEYLEKGIITEADIVAGCHCMAPRYLEDQLTRSLRNLGVDCVDIYYLHNPETQLSEISRTEFLQRVREAFKFLEAAVSRNQIQYYGMATWNGFRCAKGARDSVQLSHLVDIAKGVADTKDHHFRFIQLPFNLKMTEALTLRNQEVGSELKTVVEAAHELGLHVIGSSSLLEGQAYSRALPITSREALGLDSDLERALQFARSCPGITTALVGMSHVTHVKANARLVSVPPVSEEQIWKVISGRERG